ncbi:hypothetical protein GHA01_07520 [Novacetimonas hansenii]|uniref:Uncharacterized protein n=1 Tax=Novacetimonas hansenii TaxID=436 RepID=A0ABQ0SCF8_NOVHA|nr:hypothetical protein Gaha_0036_016 [Novacetimonas hansenii JCM 7643]GBQ54954.1 hypothetical protein AA0243_0767 [Novacetimonas hansenii NRIC 0243]GEC62903.1 hypothetical protein GHA01_07520 [Novacetimonas hansenii]
MSVATWSAGSMLRGGSGCITLRHREASTAGDAWAEDAHNIPIHAKKVMRDRGGRY